ncbi:MAG: signal transduction histidine kinase [Myxococcota bacterium]
MVTRYSGSIVVSSPPGTGACFVVRLPRSDAEIA